MNQKEQVFYASIERERLQYCCGVQETGEYESFSDNRYLNDGWLDDNPIIDRLERDKGEAFLTLREAWEDALKSVREDSGDRPIVFTFVKFKGEKQFSNEELYDLVAEQPDHLFVHGFTNPGSGNYVEMWVLTNGSK